MQMGGYATLSTTVTQPQWWHVFFSQVVRLVSYRQCIHVIQI